MGIKHFQLHIGKIEFLSGMHFYIGHAALGEFGYRTNGIPQGRIWIITVISLAVRGKIGNKIVTFGFWAVSLQKAVKVRVMIHVQVRQVPG